MKTKNPDGREEVRVQKRGDSCWVSILEEGREMRPRGTWVSVLFVTSPEVVCVDLHLETTLIHFVESLRKWLKILHFSLLILCQQKVFSTETAERIKMKPLWCSMM